MRSRAKVKSKALTQLEGAVARSQARTPSEDGEYEANTAAAIAQASARVADARTEQLINDEPSDEQAYDFAKLLRAGVPAADAFCYVVGRTEPGILELALPRWLRSRKVVDALATFNGGSWPSLDPDKRLDIALDKHYAEMAHFLYTHDFDSAEGRELGKMQQARESLEKLRTGRMEANSPFAKFLTTLLKPSVVVPALAQVMAQGERPALLGFVEVEAAVEGEVTATSEEA